MIDHNNLADYQDPVLYDLENKETEEAGDFYLALGSLSFAALADSLKFGQNLGNKLELVRQIAARF